MLLGLCFRDTFVLYFSFGILESVKQKELSESGRNFSS